MNNQVNSTLQKIPGIGDIPILGHLFKSKAAQKAQSELVVMITPHILPNDSPGVTDTLPRLVEPYLAPLPEPKTKPVPPEAFTPDRRSSISAPVPSKAAEEQRRQEKANKHKKAPEADAAAALPQPDAAALAEARARANAIAAQVAPPQTTSP